MFRLAFLNLKRRPVRNALTLAGLSVAMAVLLCLSALGRGYERALHAEIDRMGMQLMLVPLGCPFDAAARVLKGKTLEQSLPESALDAARRDPAVASAAPLLMATFAATASGRSDVWVGLEETGRDLKPWWKVRTGQPWFDQTNAVILGCDAAEVEMRAAGDSFFSPEAGLRLRVAGILERSGTSDDSLFFVPLRTAQRMFQQEGRLTAVAIRLRDPTLLREAGERLQQIPGAQVVTLTEMMGTFLNLVGAVRTLLGAVAMVAVAVGFLAVFNTLLTAVVERTREFSVMRALGASRFQLVLLIAVESLVLAMIGCVAGVGVAAVIGRGIEGIVKHILPLAPSESILSIGPDSIVQCVGIGLAAGILAVVYPAWRAGRVHPAGALKGE